MNTYFYKTPFSVLTAFVTYLKNYIKRQQHSCITEVEIPGKLLDEDNKEISILQEPFNHPDFFQLNQSFSLKDLFDAHVHYGHREGTLDPRMKPFIFGSRLGYLIFDLNQTVYHLHVALNVAANIAFRNGIILFVCRNAHLMHIVETTAKECGEYANNRYWWGGIFTNSTIQFGAVTRLPDLCIFLNTLNTVFEQHYAVRDAAKMLIPTIGIVDTNCNPNLITYPVPGNDDTPVAIELYCKLFKNAILKGKEKRRNGSKKERISDLL